MNTVRSIFRNKIFRVCLLLIVVTYPFFKDFELFYSVGDSMLPTYENGELIIIHKSKSLGKDWVPQRGQVIIALDEEDGGSLTKRVIGLAGDEIKIEHGRIYVNGKILRDSYSHQGVTFWTESEESRAKKPKAEWLFLNTYQIPFIVPEGYVWVIGDNRSMSWYGVVEIKEVKGLVLY
jgi:signal peptidase I